MKTGKLIAGGLTALCWLVICSALGTAQQSDPEIAGKPLSLWMKQLRSENRGLQMSASKALSAAPTNLHARIIPQVIPVLRSERENDKFVAAQVLGDYGPIARVAVPDLLPMLEGTQYERNRAAAAKTLGRILNDAPPSDEVEKVTQALIAAFDDKYSDVRREAVTACGMIGPAAKSCIPHLPILFEDRTRHDPMRTGATWEELNMVVNTSAWAAGRMGPLASSLMDRLVSMVHGEHGAFVAEAMGRIGATQENVVPSLMTLVERGNYWENSAAKEKAFAALEAFGAKAEPAAPLLDRFLREGKFYGAKNNLAILRIMKNIGPPAKRFEPTLKRYAELKEYPGAKSEELAEMQKAALAALEAVAGKTSAPARESK